MKIKIKKNNKKLNKTNNPHNYNMEDLNNIHKHKMKKPINKLTQI